MIGEVVPCLADNYAYIVTCEVTGRSAVVDPSEVEPVEKALKTYGRTLSAILCTHHHHDHVGGVEGLAATRPGLPVVGSAYDLEHKRIAGQTLGLADGETYAVGELVFRAVMVPGHTMGAVALVVNDAAFTGDTLFVAGCGRMFEGTPEVMQPSLARLGALDGATRIYCGHEYTEKNLAFAAHVEPDNPDIKAAIARARALRARGEPTVPSTVAEEKRTNPFLRFDAPRVRARFHTTDAVSTFAETRSAKDNF